MRFLGYALRLCEFIASNLFSIIRYSRKEETIGDTLTQNDLVTQQYAALPYPHFGEESIKQEEIHYKNNSNGEVKVGFRHLTLENINHFLFSGSENFR